MLTDARAMPMEDRPSPSRSETTPIAVVPIPKDARFTTRKKNAMLMPRTLAGVINCIAAVIAPK